MKVSILHPTMRLPQGWFGAYSSWELPIPGVEYRLCVHDTDVALVNDLPFPVNLVINKDRYCAVDAWNAAAKSCVGDVLICGADDFFAHRGWHDELVDVCSGLGEEFVLQISTGSHRDGELLTHPIVSRKTYERWGYLFYPKYLSMYSDDDLTERARMEGILVDCRKKLSFLHRHPALVSGVEVDAAYRHQNSKLSYETGINILAERRRNNFKD